MVRSLCALAFVLAAVSVQADNCQIASDATDPYVRKPTSDAFSCKSADASCTKGGPCACGVHCCDKKADVCNTVSKAVEKEANRGCAANFVYDRTKGGNAATKANFAANCCVAQAQCKSFTCVAPMKKKANNDDVYCMESVCKKQGDESKCCEPMALTCAAGRSSALSCGTGKQSDATKNAASYTDVADYPSKCCKAGVAAATMVTKKCSDLVGVCKGAMEDDAASANKTCTSPGTCEQDDGGTGLHMARVCCKTKQGVCKVLTDAKTGTCPDGTFADATKNSVAAIVSTYGGKCCTKSVTCKEFQAAVVKGTANSAMAQHSPAMLVLLVLGGAVTVAFGK